MYLMPYLLANTLYIHVVKNKKADVHIDFFSLYNETIKH